MNLSLRMLSLLVGLGVGLSHAACKHTETEPLSFSAMKSEKTNDPRWLDFGTLDVEEEVSLAMTEEAIYAQAGKTVYRKGISDKAPWKVLKTFDDELGFIYAVPGKPDTILASLAEAFETLPLRISHDGGANWASYGGEFTSDPEAIGSEYEVPKHFFLGQNAQLYASLSGTNTAVSTDLGKTWKYIYGKAGLQACYNGITAVLPSYPNLVFKGQECPLDDAWLGTFETSSTDGPISKKIDSKFLSNQRPNSFASTAALPDTLFVGVEGGFLKYDAKTSKAQWLLSAGNPDNGDAAGHIEPKDNQWYAYITSIWINPANPQHMVISGFAKGGAVNFILFETRDGGANFQMLHSPTDPNLSSKTKGSVAYGKKFAVAAREADRKVHIWLVDLSKEPK
jgi:hypothetical protein